MFILSALWKLPAGKLADALLPLAGAIVISGWLGCMVEPCGYGLPSEAWWAIPGQDEWGVLGIPGAGSTLRCDIDFDHYLVLGLDKQTHTYPRIDGGYRFVRYMRSNLHTFLRAC